MLESEGGVGVNLSGQISGRGQLPKRQGRLLLRRVSGHQMVPGGDWRDQAEASDCSLGRELGATWPANSRALLRLDR